MSTGYVKRNYLLFVEFKYNRKQTLRRGLT